MNHDTLFENQAIDANREGYETFTSDHAAYVAHGLAFFDMLAEPSAANKMTIEQFHNCDRGEAAKRYAEWANGHGGACFSPIRR